MRQQWRPEQRRAIRELVVENQLQGSEEEVERQMEALMADGFEFDNALGQVELMFAE